MVSKLITHLLNPARALLSATLYAVRHDVFQRLRQPGDDDSRQHRLSRLRLRAGESLKLSRQILLRGGCREFNLPYEHFIT